jgi:hypothetical protein
MEFNSRNEGRTALNDVEGYNCQALGSGVSGFSYAELIARPKLPCASVLVRTLVATRADMPANKQVPQYEAGTNTRAHSTAPDHSSAELMNISSQSSYKYSISRAYIIVFRFRPSCDDTPPLLLSG